MPILRLDLYSSSTLKNGGDVVTTHNLGEVLFPGQQWMDLSDESK